MTSFLLFKQLLLEGNSFGRTQHKAGQSRGGENREGASFYTGKKEEEEVSAFLCFAPL